MDGSWTTRGSAAGSAEAVRPVVRPASGKAAQEAAPEDGDVTELTAQATDLLAYGGFHRALVRPLYDDALGDFPQFGEAAEGYELIDSEGRSFVDWMCGWGPVMLGYRHPAVERAIADQLERSGPMLSLMHPIEVEVASMLVEMVPSAELVAFGKNGSDAVNAAIRIARAHTGREIVLHHGFHGFHDWYMSLQGAQGVLPVLREYARPFPYNDLDALQRLFEEFDGQVAAVVMEPTNSVLPEPGYLEGVRELAHENGALLVFDEMVTGFRLANGGAQEHFRVTPDLTCLGKAMANGMPLSAVVGKREFMRLLPGTGFGMTFRGETLSLAAARAVLTVLREEPVTEHLAQIGSQLRERFGRAAAEAGVGGELMGPDARLTIALHDHGLMMSEDLLSIFILECARRGVLVNGMVLPSYAHDAEAVDRTIEAFGAALESIARLNAEADEAMYAAMWSSFVSRNGREDGLPGACIDLMRVEGNHMRIMGWVLLEDGWPDVVEFVSATGEQVIAEPFLRPDLEAGYPQIDGCANAGYQADLPRGLFAPEGPWEFTMLAKRGAEEIFECRISRRDPWRRDHGPPRWRDGVLQV